MLSWSGTAARTPKAIGPSEALLLKPVRPSKLFDVLMGVLSRDGELRADLPQAPCTPAHDDEEPPRKALRILLAEDNAINRMVAIKILAKGGHACDVAVDEIGRAHV